MKNKEELLKSAQNDEDRLVISKAIDAAVLSEKYAAPRFTAFLDPRLLRLVRLALEKAGAPFGDFGGYDGAERRMICIFDGFADYPIDAVQICGRGTDKLCHRDVLGAVLALGIKREKIGDIFFENGRWIVFACNDISQFIAQSLEKVGNLKVSCGLCGIEGITPPEKQYKEIKGTVASTRLDCVIALVTGEPRTRAAGNIQSGLVLLNYMPETSLSATVSDGDIISVKGFGKAKITVGGKSRKGRIYITAQKYV